MIETGKGFTYFRGTLLLCDGLRKLIALTDATLSFPLVILRLIVLINSIHIGYLSQLVN